MPALSEDVYILYTHWCKREGLRAAPKNKAIDAISKRPGTRKECKRYIKNGLTIAPKTVIFPAKAEEMAPGNSETWWLGQCIENFKFACQCYMSGAYV